MTIEVMSPASLLDWTSRFARYPSQQTELFEAEPQVTGFIRDQVEPLIASLGLPFRYDRMGDLLVEIGPEKADRSLMLMAYAMTHPANRMSSPFGGEIVERNGHTLVRGRGVSEQKGSLAAAIAATKAAFDRGELKGRLVLAVSTAGETGRHDAAIAIREAVGYMPRKGVIVIGTTGMASLANKGRVDVLVTVRGKASHSSTPWVGTNAITGARKVLDAVTAIDVTGSHHPSLGHATLTPTAIRSWPDATHTVQDEVKLVFDRRLLPGDDPQAAFSAIVAAADIGEPWQVKTEFGPFMYPGEIADDGELMSAIRAGCALEGVAAPATFHSHGCLDAGYLCVNGCEATMWGPGEQAQWHSEEETISAKDLVTGARSYHGLIREYLCS